MKALIKILEHNLGFQIGIELELAFPTPLVCNPSSSLSRFLSGSNIEINVFVFLRYYQVCAMRAICLVY